MNTFGRVIKYLALALALFLIYTILKFGCMLVSYIVDGFDVNLEVDKKIVELEQDKNNNVLEILIGAAEVEIIEGDNFNVETDNKYVEVIKDGNLLKVVETKHRFSFNSKNKIVITIPKNTIFDGIAINGGAGKFTSCDLAANYVALNTGVGEFTINSLTSYKYTNIESGVGKFTINGGSLKDAKINFGVGEVNVKSKLIGNSTIESGIGRSNIVLLGSKEDYRISVEKGIGSISIDNKSVANETITGTGKNYVDISGGIGEINIDFE